MTVPANARILQAVAKPAAPAPKAEPNAIEWTKIDPASLSADLRAAYDALREANKAASALRAVFEAKLTNAIDPLDGEKVAFGYKFGSLSIAIVPADRPKRNSTALALADYLARKA